MVPIPEEDLEDDTAFLQNNPSFFLVHGWVLWATWGILGAV